ncbi:hypothetical protein DWW47_06035 [Odoribacter splanchnicus]|uniref:Uncharacterized protein n=1 Tax=Odoribacter splanchnicus TaxID=28118 RepID=A0A412WE08_9BACT|nr:hypothetical protein DWW47_06035 [Odoribacter splanchnicus]RGV25314.1 hypothetical protein DWW24_11620 [Odoribacter splanchnicus]RHA78787.1 hypothetical protein DW919_06175 [Odoribacter splanchnicus]
MLGSWVRIPAGSLFKTKKRSKLLKFNEFWEFLFSGKTSKNSGFRHENPVKSVDLIPPGF